VLCTLQTIFRHPEASSKATLRALPLKTTVGFSNMKGPAGSWALAGYKVTNIHNGVQPMAFGSFISLFSYGQTLTFTHTCFETKTKQPEVCSAVTKAVFVIRLPASSLHERAYLVIECGEAGLEPHCVVHTAAVSLAG